MSYGDVRLLEAFSNVFLGIGYLIVLVIASVMAVYACVNLQNKVVFEISAGLWDGRCILWIVATASKYSWMFTQEKVLDLWKR